MPQSTLTINKNPNYLDFMIQSSLYLSCHYCLRSHYCFLFLYYFRADLAGFTTWSCLQSEQASHTPTLSISSSTIHCSIQDVVTKIKESMTFFTQVATFCPYFIRLLSKNRMLLILPSWRHFSGATPFSVPVGVSFYSHWPHSSILSCLWWPLLKGLSFKHPR